MSNIYAVRWLSKLCLEYNLDIVITSTWLIGHDLGEIKFALYSSELDKRINIIDGANKNYFKTRGTQIESWMNSYNYDIDKSIFIILDDDTDMVGFKRDLTSYLIKCNTYTGFGMEEYSHACTLLDKLIEERDTNYNEKK